MNLKMISLPRDKYCFWVRNKQKLKKLRLYVTHEIINPRKTIIHYIYKRGVGVVGLSIKNFQILMEKRAQQNGWLFIYFVNFNSTLVYSVVWNHSAVYFQLN